VAKLIYSMLVSLDGCTEDAHARFGWAAPDEQVFSYINNALMPALGTYLYGRRMYDTMVYWEVAHTVPNQTEEERRFDGGVVFLQYGVRREAGTLSLP
jgi:hypothetical protein